MFVWFYLPLCSFSYTFSWGLWKTLYNYFQYNYFKYLYNYLISLKKKKKILENKVPQKKNNNKK